MNTQTAYDIKQALYKSNFTGELNLDKYQIQELTDAAANIEEVESVFYNYGDEIESKASDAQTEIEEFSEKHLPSINKMLADILHLAEINDLPEHFTEHFAEQIEDTREFITDLIKIELSNLRDTVIEIKDSGKALKAETVSNTLSE